MGCKPTPGVRRRCPAVVQAGAAKKGGEAPRLQQPAFGKTQDVATGDNQVIQQFYVHQRQRRLQCLCQQLVGTRGLSRPAWMVVYQGFRDYFARIVRGLAHRAARQFDVFDQAVLPIELCVATKNVAMTEPSSAA